MSGSLWQNIMNFASENYKDISGSWNYYNDGKQWPFKMVLKKKTIFSPGVYPDNFRITFYSSVPLFRVPTL
jgi:hypothetical protein